MGTCQRAGSFSKRSLRPLSLAILTLSQTTVSATTCGTVGSNITYANIDGGRCRDRLPATATNKAYMNRYEVSPPGTGTALRPGNSDTDRTATIASTYLSPITMRQGARARRPSRIRQVSCNLDATIADFASQVSAATVGQVICLASGDYGTWNGTNKAITITKQSGATATMRIDFGQETAVSRSTALRSEAVASPMVLII